MATGSFPEVKRPGLSVDHQPPSSTKVKERELYLYSSYGLCRPFYVEFYLYLAFYKFFDVSNWKLLNFKQKL
jgi:hypothetical protein